MYNTNYYEYTYLKTKHSSDENDIEKFIAVRHAKG